MTTFRNYIESENHWKKIRLDAVEQVARLFGNPNQRHSITNLDGTSNKRNQRHSKGRIVLPDSKTLYRGDLSLVYHICS